MVPVAVTCRLFARLYPYKSVIADQNCSHPTGNCASRAAVLSGDGGGDNDRRPATSCLIADTRSRAALELPPRAGADAGASALNDVDDIARRGAGSEPRRLVCDCDASTAGWSAGQSALYVHRRSW